MSATSSHSLVRVVALFPEDLAYVTKLIAAEGAQHDVSSRHLSEQAPNTDHPGRASVFLAVSDAGCMERGSHVSRLQLIAKEW